MGIEYWCGYRDHNSELPIIMFKIEDGIVAAYVKGEAPIDILHVRINMEGKTPSTKHLRTSPAVHISNLGWYRPTRYHPTPLSIVEQVTTKFLNLTENTT